MYDVRRDDVKCVWRDACGVMRVACDYVSRNSRLAFPMSLSALTLLMVKLSGYRLLQVTLHFAQKAHSRLTILQELRVACTYGEC